MFWFNLTAEQNTLTYGTKDKWIPSASRLLEGPKHWAGLGLREVKALVTAKIVWVCKVTEQSVTMKTD